MAPGPFSDRERFVKVVAFLGVGALNTLLGIAAYGFLLRLGAPFPLASGLSLLLGILVGFQAHRRLVFRRHGVFLRYLAVWICIYGLANLQIWVLQRWLGALMAGIAAMPLNSAAAFLALRHFVFKSEPAGAADPAGPPAPPAVDSLEPPTA